MTPGAIAALGALAGLTIFLGLPIGRIRRRSLGLSALLNAVTIGVLLFLLWDVITHAIEPIDAAVASSTHDAVSLWKAVGFTAVFFVAIAIGLLSLVAYDRSMKKRAALEPHASGTPRSPLRLHEHASRTAFLIAVGIGLHNFSEGLAIGQSAVSGQISLAVVLVVGFGLHNATEGFGITAPLAGDQVRPSWTQLAILGVIGGGPTVVGTLLGSVFVSDIVSLAFLALAAGSIIYVIIQLIGVAMKLARGTALHLGLLAGLFAGFVTDFIVTAAGV